MTRSGSLAYYLAAWVCGCFFLSATVWMAGTIHPTEDRTVSLLLYIYFLSLMFGAVMSLLFAFFLRRMSHRLHWKRTWHWLTGGAILAPALTAALGSVARSPLFEAGSWRNWIFVPLGTTYLPPSGGLWMALLAAPAGTATAWILFRVDRAFRMPAGNSAEPLR